MSEHRRRQTPEPRPGGRVAPSGGNQRSPGDGAPRAFGTEAPGSRSRAESRQAPRGDGSDRGAGGGRRGGNGGRGTPPGGSGRPGGPGGGSGRGRGDNRRPAKKRFIDYPRFGKRGVRRWLPSFKQVLALFVLFIGTVMGAVGIAYAMVKVPNANSQVNFQSNTYYYSDGKTELGRSGAVNRQ